jgi:hypothetical protein
MSREQPSTAPPLVSIITPSLNQGRFIRDTIESVLSQTHPRVEYIVVDGGSSDETLSILREYGDRVKWISEPDRGQTHAINKGFHMARGEILAWLNSDDVLLPGAASHAVSAFASTPHAGFVYGNAYVIDEFAEPMGAVEIQTDHDPWTLANCFDYVVQPSAFFRASALEAVGWLDESYHWAMDWEVFIRLSRRFESVRIPAFMSCMRDYDETKSRSGGFARLAELSRVVERYADRRFAPAYRVYAVNTLAVLAERAIGRATAALGMDPLLPVLMLRGPQMKLERLASGRRSLHADGWVGRRLSLHERRHGDVLVLRGEIPPLYNQSLDLRWAGRRIARLRLPPGRFTACVPIDGEQPAQAKLEVNSARSFVPRRRYLNGDPRRLSFRLESMDWSSRSDVPVWFSEGRFADGWAGPRVRLIMRRDGTMLRLRGHVERARQRIAVFCDGRGLAVHELEEGPFELLVPVPSSVDPLDLELCAERILDLPGRPRRRAAYVLNDVSWSQ